ADTKIGRGTVRDSAIPFRQTHSPMLSDAIGVYKSPGLAGAFVFETSRTPCRRPASSFGMKAPRCPARNTIWLDLAMSAAISTLLGSLARRRSAFRQVAEARPEARQREIEEGAQFDRHEAGGRVDEADRQGWRLKILQQWDELAGFQEIPELIGKQRCDPD